MAFPIPSKRRLLAAFALATAFSGSAMAAGSVEMQVEHLVKQAMAEGGPMVLGYGNKFNPVQVSPQDSQFLDTIKANQAIARNLAPSDLVGTVHWLISDTSRLVTGQTIAVDGGTVMH